MSHPKVIRARVTRNHEKRILELCEKTGLSTSEVIRELIDNVQVEEKTILSLRTSFPVNANSDVTTLQGSHAAVAP